MRNISCNERPPVFFSDELYVNPPAGRAYLIILPTVIGKIGYLSQYSVVEVSPGAEARLPPAYVTALEPPNEIVADTGRCPADGPL